MKNEPKTYSVDMTDNYEDNILQGMARIMFLVIKESNDSKLILTVHEEFTSTFNKYRLAGKVSFEFLSSLIIANCSLFDYDPKVCRDTIMEKLNSAGAKEVVCNYWSFYFE
jgi:hypothetical protein